MQQGTSGLLARIKRLEDILKQFETEPPPLPDADKLFIRLSAIDGRIESLTRQFTQYDTLPDMINGVAHRVTDLENRQPPIPSTPDAFTHEGDALFIGTAHNTHEPVDPPQIIGAPIHSVDGVVPSLKLHVDE